MQAATGSDELQPYSSAFEAVLDFYAAGVLIAYMLADHIVDPRRAVGRRRDVHPRAWAFAYVYVVIQAVEPGSFSRVRA